jgi:hypothetical protein
MEHTLTLMAAGLVAEPIRELIKVAMGNGIVVVNITVHIVMWMVPGLLAVLIPEYNVIPMEVGFVLSLTNECILRFSNTSNGLYL